jgi:Cu2+-exporting ATPase
VTFFTFSGRAPGLRARGGVPYVAAPAEIPAPNAGQAEACFHCGLALLPDERWTTLIAGQRRRFCCAGCEAVARAIVDQGLADYYRLRVAPTGERPHLGLAFETYDEPAVQQSFVRAAPAGAREAALALKGIRCSACVWLNEETLRRLPGVVSAAVNYATRRAVVCWDPGRIALSEILSAIARIGYRAFPYAPERADAIHRAERRGALWRLFVAGFGMMQVTMYAVPAYLAGDGTLPDDIAQLLRWASLCLTVPVVGYSAQPFFLGAWRALRTGRFGMDVPVAVGIGAAFAASVWATVIGAGEVYFDSVTMFVFLLLAGRFLELGARHRSTEALAHLARLAPALAERLTGFPDSLASERVAAPSLRPGDLVLIRPGEAVPADGVVVRGRGAVDEALLTGEATPREKRPGSGLIGGSINLTEALVARVERVGAETVLAGIGRLVERALGERQPLAELADRYAHWFVVVVLALAGATALAWSAWDPSRALWVAVSVLVVTCPCALSLATPAALAVATGELARRGFVVARGHTIEALARATDVVFDKTGTLTHGEPRVTVAAPVGGEPLAACVAVARAIEEASEHPIAKAIVRYADEAGAPRLVGDELANHPGRGIEALVGRRRYRIGTPAFCAGIAGAVARPEASTSAATTVFLAGEQGWLARFELGDALKPDAAALIRALAGAGKRVHLLSGDGAAATARVATAAGIAQFRAAAEPAAKQAYVRSLQAAGALVAMIGDGVNDAPVLAQADVSVAMGQGADLAQAQADAVLVSGRLATLGEAFDLAARAMRVIRQNLGWAFAYNLAAIPAAAAGLVTPWLAGIGMSVSSLAVVLNALRLRRRNAVGANARTPWRQVS